MVVVRSGDTVAALVLNAVVLALRTASSPVETGAAMSLRPAAVARLAPAWHSMGLSPLEKPTVEKVAKDLIGYELARAIADDVVKLLQDLSEGDNSFHEDKLGSMQYTLGIILEFILHSHGRLVRFEGVPTTRPGETVARLLTALQDLERGVGSPMLAPAPEPRRATKPDKSGTMRGRRPQGGPTAVLKLRAEAAGIMQLLILAGYKERNAAEVVARALDGHPMFANSRGENWRTIDRWRFEMGAGSPAAQHYEAVLKEADKLIDLTEVDRRSALERIALSRLESLSAGRFGTS